MKTFTSIVTLIVIVLLCAPAFGDDERMSQRMLYEAAIDTEIAQSRQMASLMTSRSENLRKKGHREASKAMFLETHRDTLVEDMMAKNLEPKTYKVERYLNDRFSSTGYNTWAAMDK